MKKLWLTIAILLLMIVVANADIIQPTAVISQEYVFNGAVDTINNDRMITAVNDGDTLASALTATHEYGGTYDGSYVSTDPGGYPSDFFASLPGGDTDVDIVYDLTGGGNTDIGTVILWQYENSGGGDGRAGNAARTIEIRINTEAEGSATFSGSPTIVSMIPVIDGDSDPDNDLGGTNSAQGFDLGGIKNGRYVQLSIMDNHYGLNGMIAGGDRVGLAEVRFATEAPPWAKAPILVYPLDSDSPTVWDLTLEWIPGGALPNPDGYNIYLDPNESKVADPDTWGLAPLNGGTLDPDPDWPVTGLAPDTTYYWKVVAVDIPATTPPNDPNTYPSNIASFTTLPETPVITLDPVNQTVPLNSTVEFTVEALNVDPGEPDEGFQWYKDGQEMSGETSATLAISNVTLGDEGYYHCVASNPAGDTPSQIARLVTERLLAHWEFESDNMNDTAPGGYHHGAIFPIGGDPNYVAGIVGTRAIQFDHDQHEAMIVSRDPNLITDSFTISLWAKLDVLPGSHQAVVSFRDDFPTRGYILYAAPADKWEYWSGSGSGWHGLGSGDPLTDVIAGAWTHLAISYEQTGYAGTNLTGTKKLYVNGRLAATATDIILSWTDISTDLQIGAGENESTTHNFFFDGAVDDVQLHTYALDSVTIAQMYNTVTGEVICVDERPLYDIVPSTDDPSDPSYCIVDLRDFAEWASHWLDCNRVPDCLP